MTITTRLVGRLGGQTGEAFYSAQLPLLEGWTTIAIMTVREPSRAILHIQVPGGGSWGDPRPAVRLRNILTEDTHEDTHEYIFSRTDAEHILMADIGPGEWAAEFTGSRADREHFEAQTFAAIAPLT